MTTDKDNQKYEIYYEEEIIKFRNGNKIIEVTDAQAMILRLILEGNTCKAIAQELSLSVKIIQCLIDELMLKFECNSEIQLLITLKNSNNLHLLPKIDYRGKIATNKDNLKYEIYCEGKHIKFRNGNKIIEVTDRQAAILRLLLEGKTCKAIAQEFCVSYQTLRCQIEGLMYKFECGGIRQLIIEVLNSNNPHLLQKFEYKNKDEYLYDEVIFNNKKLYLRKGDKEIILTYNQMIVLLQILEGHTAKNVARKVLKEPKGVNDYTEILKEKFECSTKSELIAKCHRSKLAYYLWCIYPIATEIIED